MWNPLRNPGISGSIYSSLLEPVFKLTRLPPRVVDETISWKSASMSTVRSRPGFIDLHTDCSPEHIPKEVFPRVHAARRRGEDAEKAWVVTQALRFREGGAESRPRLGRTNSRLRWTREVAAGYSRYAGWVCCIQAFRLEPFQIHTVHETDFCPAARYSPRVQSKENYTMLGYSCFSAAKTEPQHAS